MLDLIDQLKHHCTEFMGFYSYFIDKIRTRRAHHKKCRIDNSKLKSANVHHCIEIDPFRRPLVFFPKTMNIVVNRCPIQLTANS